MIFTFLERESDEPRMGIFRGQDYPFNESDAFRHADEIGFAFGFKMPIPWVPEITGLLK